MNEFLLPLLRRVSPRRLEDWRLLLVLLLLTARAVTGAPGDPEAGFQPIVHGSTTTIAVQTDGKILIAGHSFVSRLEPDGSVDFNFSTSGGIRCMAVQTDGSIFAGGASSVGGCLWRLHEDGSQDFGFASCFDRAIFCMALQEDGRILAGGVFTDAGGVSRNGMARLNPDGSLDPSFNPDVGSPSLASVSSMALQADGEIVLAGDFTTVGGVSRPWIARINADGSLDAGFHPVPDAVVFNVAAQKDGKILMSGYFTTVDGVPRNGLARLNSDGSLDASFDPRPESNANYFALQADGRIIVTGGYFLGGKSIVRLNADGSRDGTFVAGTNDPPLAIALDADGRLLLAECSNVPGNPQNSLLRLQNGPVVSALSLEGSSTLRWLRDGAVPEVTRVVFEKRATADSAWTLLGSGQRVAGGWEITGVAAPAGGAFRALGHVAGGGLVQRLLPVGDAVPLLTVQQAGQTLTGGDEALSFGSVYGANEHDLNFTVSNPGNGTLGPLTVSFAGVNSGDFTVVRAPVSEVAPFESTGFSVRFAPSAEGVRSAVLNLASNVSPSPFTVNLKGLRKDRLDPSFASAASVPVSRDGFSAEGMTFGDLTLTFSPPLESVLTAVENTGANPISGRFIDLPDNAVVSAVFNGETFRFIVSYTGGTGNDLTLRRFKAGDLDFGFALQPSDYVKCVAVQNDGKVLIGGVFNSIYNGIDVIKRGGLARINADGTLDASFHSSVDSGDSTVESIVVQPDGKILVGGFFGIIGGVLHNRIARLLPDGKVDAGFNPDANGPVLCMAMAADGKILLGGQFTSIGGVPRQDFARLHADGTLDAAFNPNPARNFGAAIRTIAVQADGKIIIGGVFTSVRAIVRNGLARLNPDGSLDSAFNPAPNINPDGEIASIAIQPDGKIIVSGSFTTISGVARNWLARLNPNGSIDPGFNPNPSFPASTIVLQSDGKILLGGRFKTIGGATRTYLARLHPDGTLDAGFNASILFPNAGFVYYLCSYGPGAFPEVDGAGLNSLAVQADGRIVVGGAFLCVGGESRFHLARLLNDDAASSMELASPSTVRWLRSGSSPEIADVTIEARIPPSAAWTSIGRAQRVAGGWELSGLSLPASGSIRALGFAADGRASTGTMRSYLAFGPPVPGISVQHPAETELESGASMVSFGANFGTNSRTLEFTVENTGNTSLDALAVTFGGPDAGDFSLATPLAASLAPFRSTSFSVKYAPSGPRESTATLQIANSVPGASPFVTPLSGARADSLSPFFPTAAEVPVTRNGFTAGIAPGPLTLGFAPTAGTVLTLVNNTGGAPINGRLSGLPDGGMISSAFGGQTLPFMAWYFGGTGNDLVLTLFGPGLLDTAYDSRISGSVKGAALLPDGRCITGGVFSTPGVPPGRSIARLNSGGSPDTSFSGSTSGDVRCIAIQADGKAIVAGAFSEVNGVPRKNIARLHPDGTLDTDFNPGTNQWVSCLAVQADDKIILGGEFTTAGGATRNRIARLLPNGALDTGFDPGANQGVRCVAVQADGKIILGGEFTDVGGSARSHIARLNADGSLDAAFTASATAGVYAVAVQADGKILIGGFFIAAGGASRNRIARLQPDGSLDMSFAPAVSDTVSSFAVQADGRIIIGGSFTIVAGVGRRRMARLNADGSLDMAFDPNVGGSSVVSLTVQPDGRILAGGLFSSVGGLQRSGFARLGNDPAISTLRNTGAAGIRWLRGGASPEVSEVAFDVKEDTAAAWMPLGAGQRTDGGWEVTGLSLPAEGEIRARARSGGSLMESVAPILTDAEHWRVQYFGSPLNAGEAANLADPDLDGLPNLLEFAYGLNPTRPDTGALPQVELSGGDIAVAFATPEGVSGITYGAERSSTLLSGSWTAIPDTGTGGQHRFITPLNGGRQFLRLKVSAQ